MIRSRFNGSGATLIQPSSRDVGKVITAIPIERMRQVYGEVKTPFKYGVVIRGITGPLAF
jgi:hypothetical protein